MNHQLATYIDFIQSIGFISIFAVAVSLTTRLLSDNKKDNYIQSVKIRVEE
tara:strand:+ start:442 stop:594 length:153 start_codon:yes stop_codon:yes gene_type:complete